MIESPKGKENNNMMNKLNALLEISNICRDNNIKATIDETGLYLSTWKDGKKLSRHFNLDEINTVTTNLPMIVLFDIFLEESVLKFNRA
jgi:hypothetical protein